ncbi:MAG: OsmC family protein [Saprospiraceae bacterium]|nr:OsmC family protein [Saprospiraceae bacterium]
MEIQLKRLNNAYHLRASNENGNTVEMDGSPAVGGSNSAMRPMQTLLSALGGCSAIDVISILNKQRQQLDDLEIDIKAVREEDKEPALFTTIHVHYRLFGNLKEDKVQQAVSLSMEKYCSVAKILEKTAEITYDYEIVRPNAFDME